MNIDREETSRQSSMSKSRAQRNLIFGVISVFISLLVLCLFITFGIREFKQRRQNKLLKINDICMTLNCIKAANHLLERMNESIDPCENFYGFSCGSWMKNTKILNGQYIDSALEQINANILKNINELLSSPSRNNHSNNMEPNFIRNTRRLYESCIDEYRIEKRNLTTFEFLCKTEFDQFINDSSLDLIDLLLKLNEYNTFLFYHVETDVDEKNSEKAIYRIEISPGRLIDALGNVLITSEKNSILSNRREPKSMKKDSLSTFSKQIAINLWTPKDEALADFEDILTTVKNLSQTINTTFDFTTYIRRLYKQANITLSDDLPVAVYKLEAIRKISLIINEYSSSTILEYAMTHFVAPQYLHMPARYRITIDQMQKPLGLYNKETRAIQCAKYVFKNMKLAVSKLYNDHYNERFQLVEITEMMRNIQNEFVEMINQSTWIDPNSKQSIIEKAHAIVERIGYPGFLINDNITVLEDFYKEHDFNDSHVENVLLLLRLNAKRNLRKINQSIFREDCCDYDPITANAFYAPFFNEIVIPTTILEPPFFHKDAPKYLNYGAIGSVIGHEITHGFDDSRRHFDKDRKNYTLWSNETANIYHKRSTCLIEQYNNYTVKEINRTIDGSQTLNENIADNDGLKKSFYAYQKWLKNSRIIEKKLPGLTNYTAEQLFFISYAQLWCTKMTDKHLLIRINFDVHSLPEFRVIGSTSNMIEFDRVFRCQAGQRNSRINKCSVW